MRVKSISEELDLFANSSDPELERKWASVRKTQDPYAYYSVFGDQEDAEPTVSGKSISAVPTRHVAAGLSKKDFQNECRRIFRQYIPPSEGQVLRPQYRDFIFRNEQRSPGERANIVTGLSKYDLSSSGNFKPHFNREQELLTVAKLQDVENTALKSRVSK